MFTLQTLRVGHVREGNAHPHRLAVLLARGHNLNLDEAVFAVGGRPFDLADEGRPTFCIRPVYQRAQLEQRLVASQLKILEGAAQIGEAQIEEPTRLLVGSHHGPPFVHEHLTDPGTLEGGGSGRLGRRQAAGLVLTDRRLWADARRLGEDATALIGGSKGVPATQQQFRLPEEQETSIVKRKAKMIENSLLSLSVEIDHGVAANQQVDVRDRRVLNQIMATEDDCTAKVPSKDIPLVGAFEIPLAQVFGNRLHLLGSVVTMSSLCEGFLVHIRRVDLYPPADQVAAVRFGQQHCERVGLLSRRASSTPDPHDVVRLLSVEHTRKNLVAEVLPIRWITEEVRDVDEDCVEQVDELFGMHF